MLYWTSCLGGVVMKRSGGRQTWFVTIKFKRIYWNGFVSFSEDYHLYNRYLSRIEWAKAFPSNIQYFSLPCDTTQENCSQSRGSGPCDTSAGDPAENFSSEWGCDKPSQTCQGLITSKLILLYHTNKSFEGKEKRKKKKKGENNCQPDI